MRYIVERKPDVFEDVGAPFIKIDGGSLHFFDAESNLIVAYAQGQWLTVVTEVD